MVAITDPPAAKVLPSLLANPVAPEEGFEKFVVGTKIMANKQYILDKIKRMRNITSPSQILVVTADNGNGKTLLSNMIKEELSKKNEQPNENDKIGCKFEFFFSHVRAHEIDAAEIGYHIVKGLQI